MQMQRAQELLKEVPILIDVSAYNSAVNRSYYAAFHAMKALEALEGFDSKNIPARLPISGKTISKPVFCLWSSQKS